MLVAALVAGCSASKRTPKALTPAQMQAVVLASQPGPAGDSAADENFQNSYRINPGDMIDVKFAYHPQENERTIVRPDGRIELQVAGEVEAGGLTPHELEKSVAKAASVRLKNPVVTVSLSMQGERRVYVGGDVAKPGFVSFREGMTPIRAIVERGGPLDTANLGEVMLITREGSQVKSVKMDLRAVAKGEADQNVSLIPGDIVIIPRSFIGKADIWVDQWIRALLPVVPSAGFDLLQVLVF